MGECKTRRYKSPKIGERSGRKRVQGSPAGVGGVPHLSPNSPQEWGAGGLKQLFAQQFHIGLKWNSLIGLLYTLIIM